MPEQQNPSTNNEWLPFLLRACLVVGVILGGVLWKWGDSLSFGNGWPYFTLLGLTFILICVGLFSDLAYGGFLGYGLWNPTTSRRQQHQLVIWHRDQLRRKRMTKSCKRATNGKIELETGLADNSLSH